MPLKLKSDDNLQKSSIAYQIGVMDPKYIENFSKNTVFFFSFFFMKDLPTNVKFVFGLSLIIPTQNRTFWKEWVRDQATDGISVSNIKHFIFTKSIAWIDINHVDTNYVDMNYRELERNY